MKTEKFYLQDEFEQWLIDTGICKDTSAASYISYVKNANKYYAEKNGGKALLEKIKSNFTDDNIEDLINQAVDNLSEETKAPKPKTIQNYQSALYRYKDFLLQYTVNVNNFSKSDLIKIFSSRMTTQDRYYEKIFYPIRCINRISRETKRRDDFKRLLDELLNKIEIVIDNNGNVTTLNDVKSLTILDNRVMITTNGNKSAQAVFTKLADGEDKYGKLCVERISKIAIDHVSSLCDIMNVNAQNLPVIAEITTALKEEIEGRVTYKKLCDASRAIDISGVDVEALLKEVKFIFGATNLQLMDSTENTKKGKNS